jgi:hypothetical protein
MKERDHSEDLVTDGRIILNSFKDVDWIRVEWIYFIQERDNW